MSRALFCDNCERKIEESPSMIIKIPGFISLDFCHDCAKRMIEKLRPEEIKHEQTGKR
jgi:hypothetical protein